MEQNSIFRQKSLDKISAPEKLDDYIRVTTPCVWLTLIAIVLLLAGVLIWGIFGKITIHHADGSAEAVAPITFIIN